MSSHSVRLSKALRDLQNTRKTLKIKGLLDEYDRGMFNGITLALCMMQNVDFEFDTKDIRKQEYEATFDKEEE